jgi:heat shock protein HtpX
MVTLMVVANLLGLRSYLTPYGIDYGQLAGFSLLWGMGGAFISLLISKPLAKFSMKVKVVDPETTDSSHRNLVQTVYRLAQAAGLNKMPEIGIYESPEVNAFATGATKNSALVAVSSGLYAKMSPDELEGVLGHEVAHIANGDMVTMTLIQGVMNAVVIFLAKAIAWAAAQALRSDDDESPSFWLAFAIEMALQVLFGIGAMVVVNWFSRKREFRADAGSAKIAGAGKMIASLRVLRSTTELIDGEQPQVASLKIAGRGSVMALLSTHPSLDERIRRLEVLAGHQSA